MDSFTHGWEFRGLLRRSTIQYSDCCVLYKTSTFTLASHMICLYQPLLYFLEHVWKSLDSSFLNRVVNVNGLWACTIQERCSKMFSAKQLFKCCFALNRQYLRCKHLFEPITSYWSFERKTLLGASPKPHLEPNFFVYAHLRICGFMDFGGFSDLTTDLRISKDHLAHKGQLFLLLSQWPKQTHWRWILP